MRNIADIRAALDSEVKGAVSTFESMAKASLNLDPIMVREVYNPHGHFFARKTMKFFGDCMASFRCVTLPDPDTCESTRYMFRRIGATVNVLGRTKRVTLDDYSGSWIVIPEIDSRGYLSGHYELSSTSEAVHRYVYDNCDGRVRRQKDADLSGYNAVKDELEVSAWWR